MCFTGFKMYLLYNLVLIFWNSKNNSAHVAVVSLKQHILILQGGLWKHYQIIDTGLLCSFLLRCWFIKLLLITIICVDELLMQTYAFSHFSVAFTLLPCQKIFKLLLLYFIPEWCEVCMCRKMLKLLKCSELYYFVWSPKSLFPSREKFFINFIQGCKHLAAISSFSEVHWHYWLGSL